MMLYHNVHTFFLFIFNIFNILHASMHLFIYIYIYYKLYRICKIILKGLTITRVVQ